MTHRLARPTRTRHDFAVDISDILDGPVRQTDDPIPLPLAFDIGAFLIRPERTTNLDPVAVALVVDVGAFRAAPVNIAKDPVAVALAVDIGPSRVPYESRMTQWPLRSLST